MSCGGLPTAAVPNDASLEIHEHGAGLDHRHLQHFKCLHKRILDRYSIFIDSKTGFVMNRQLRRLMCLGHYGSRKFKKHGLLLWQCRGPKARKLRKPSSMDRRQNMLIGIVVAIVVVGAAIGVTGFTNRLLGPLRTHVTFESSESVAAPELAIGDWINSEPLKLKDLRGRVVLIEFWTFGCYNCRNTLPFVKRWDDRYCDKGLTVVGVHSPELDNERKIENVRREVVSLGIRYPVVTDNDYQTWRAYNVEAWPTIFLLNKQGRIRWMHVGEGAYDEAEQMIQKMLAEEDKQSEDRSKMTKPEKQ